METKKKRIRRTNAEVEEAISMAMDRLVEKYGLLKITPNMVMSEAGIESPVFYNRYNSIDDLIYEYVREKDFWVSGTIPYKEIEKLGPEEYYIQTLLMLSDLFQDSKYARDVLIWELMSESDSTKKMAKLREMDNETLLVYYSKIFKGTDFNIRAFTALLISGIYYMHLHKDKSTFCGIDLNSKKDKDNFVKTLRKTVNRLFANIQNDSADNKTIEIAKKMSAKGIDTKTISEILDMEEEDIKGLSSSSI